MDGLPISLVVIALNEEHAIARCLLSAQGVVNEVVVVDSGSTDNTAALSRELGARVIEQDWLGYSRQRQVGIGAATNDWVLCLDADEMLSPELAESIRALFGGGVPSGRRVFSMSRTIDFLGVELPNPLRRSNTRDFVRLFDRRHARWDESAEIHERVLYLGRPELLRGRLIHWQGLSFSEEIEALNKYSSAEAQAMQASNAKVRRWALVALPVARFCWVYIARGHALYGWRGLLHSLLRGAWELSKLVKHWELVNEPRNLRTPPDSVYRVPDPRRTT